MIFCLTGYTVHGTSLLSLSDIPVLKERLALGHNGDQNKRHIFPYTREFHGERGENNRTL